MRDRDSTVGSGPPASTARASVSASRSRPVNRSGSTSSASSMIALRITRVGDLAGLLEQAHRGRRCPLRHRVRRPSQPRHRFGVAGLGAEHQVTRHPVRRHAGAAEHGGRFPVQSLAHGQREIVIDGVAYEIVAKAQTIAGLAEQPGLARGGQRREQLRRGAAGHERQLGHRERRTQDRGHPQHVQHVLREPAEAAQDREPQGRWQRRPASLRPPTHQLQRPVLIERTARVR